MAKKRFTEGMESLFGDSHSDTKATHTLSLFPDDPSPSASKDDDRRSSHGKGFTSQLEAFLAEAFDAITTEEDTSDYLNEDAAARSRRPRTGLDLLIRSTADQEDFKPQTHTTRRVTLVFPKEHLEKLKTAAKDQNLYLKDIINQLVERYIVEKGL